MKCKKINDKYFVRIDKGEEIISCLQQVCEENEIRLGKVSAIGAVDKVTIGLFEPATKQYHSTTLTGDYEITSLLGNITTMHEKIYLHIHANLSDEQHRAFGGHLNEAVVCATCEAVIEQYEGEMERFYDPEIGLNLLKI